MTLITASAAKTASDEAAIQTRVVLTSTTLADIDTAIRAQATRTDLDERTYKAVIVLACTFIADVEQIVQADDSKIPLSAVVSALTDAGYRVAPKVIKANRAGVNDKVRLQVAWN